MRLVFISFSRKGWELENSIACKIRQSGKHTVVMRKVKCSALADISEKREISECIKEWVAAVDGFIFIGACGIAVRIMAPYVVNKTIDPAVIVLDESGKFCISLLSGHLGGANDLAEYISEITGAIPVITTATDIEKKFSVDLFAKKNNLFISDMKTAKNISAEIVDGNKIGMVCDFNIKGHIPSEIVIDLLNKEFNFGIAITIKKALSVFDKTLILNPRVVTIGVGCKKGISLMKIHSAIMTCLDEMNISINAVETVASIDIKKSEKGIIDFCNKYGLKFKTYTSEELLSVKGEFNESDFVMKTTGVGSVCERSAVFCSKGKLIMSKRVLDGVTVALATKDRSVCFED